MGGNKVANANATTPNSTNVTSAGRSGRYDKTAGSWKVYGNPTQGSTQNATHLTSTQTSCMSRELYLAVVATTDSATLMINLKSADFQPEESNDGGDDGSSDESAASFIQMTFAAVVALFAFTLF